MGLSRNRATSMRRIVLLVLLAQVGVRCGVETARDTTTSPTLQHSKGWTVEQANRMETSVRAAMKSSSEADIDCMIGGVLVKMTPYDALNPEFANSAGQFREVAQI